MIYGQLKPLIEEELGVKVLGYVPKLTDLNLESRHLGLVLPGEIEALKEKLNRLAAVLEETLDLDAFCALAEDTEELTIQVPEIPVLEAPKKIRLAVAADDAFCFTYQDNLKLLETMGAELVFFSPLQDKKLPEEVGWHDFKWRLSGTSCKDLERKSLYERSHQKSESRMVCPVSRNAAAFSIFTGSWKDRTVCSILWQEYWMRRPTGRTGWDVLDILP